MPHRHLAKRKILDDLTYLDISRQRKYQIRKMREGMCIICGVRKAYRGTILCLSDHRKRGIMVPGVNKIRAKKWIRGGIDVQWMRTSRISSRAVRV